MRARHAALLGLLHGPAELVPVSSSGHVALLPWLLRWDAGAGGPESSSERRKELEVALHTGTGVALAWLLRRETAAALRGMDARRLGLHVAALGVPSLVGGLLERSIEERLGTPAITAAGLVAGAALLVAADAAGRGSRAASSAGPADGLALGIAQAAALVPGVSRRGTTLAAARLRGFDRAGAGALSWEVALPLLAAATALKGARLAAAPPPRAHRGALAAGAGAAMAGTLAAAPLLRAVERWPWWPYAVERVVVAGAVALRLRRAACEDPPR